MSEIWEHLVSGSFMPHGHCYLWLPEILWTHVTSDALIAAAYYSIPLSIIAFLRKRKDVELRAVPIMFSAFIFLCGTTHLFGIFVVWNGYYGIQGMIKAAAALISVLTAIMVWRLMPVALAIPSNKQLADEVASATAELQEKNRQLSAANAEIKQFVSAVSHDLKEPLRTLVAFSQSLEKNVEDNHVDDVKTDLGHIVSNVKRMKVHIHDLLDLTIASRGEVSFERVPLNDCVDAALHSLGASLTESRAVVDRQDLPIVVGHRSSLTQLFQNLISNALKFAQPGTPPKIAITVETSENGERVFGVMDNGLGIDPEHYETIFQPYKRLHGQDHSEGSGMGLTICRRTVERHKGRIWVESGQNGGAHFRFVINSDGQLDGANEFS